MGPYEGLRNDNKLTSQAIRKRSEVMKGQLEKFGHMGIVPSRYILGTLDVTHMVLPPAGEPDNEQAVEAEVAEDKTNGEEVAADLAKQTQGNDY